MPWESSVLQKQEKTRKVVLGLAVIVIVAVALLFVVVWLPNRASSPATVTPTIQGALGTCKSTQQMGKGEFVLPIVDRNGFTGKNLDLSDFRCKVIVLEFMGPWCPPCQQSVSALETLYKQYADKGVVFIAVAEPWNPSMTHYQNVGITEFLAKYPSSLTYVDDSKGTIASLYNVTELPMLFILSKSGPMRATYSTGEGVSSPSVAKDIDEALSEPEPA